MSGTAPGGHDAATAAARRRRRLLAAAAALAGIAALALHGADWAVGMLALTGAASPSDDGRFWAALTLYAVLMAVPFCPGIEVGLALLALFGAAGAPCVYLATVSALVAAFAVGRFVPPSAIVATLDALGLHRARDLLRRIEPLAPHERLALLQAGSPRLAFLTRQRHVALAIALNLPGNIVLGDGGGIALAAGFSRLVSLRAFVLTTAVAVAPVPLAVMVFWG